MFVSRFLGKLPEGDPSESSSLISESTEDILVGDIFIFGEYEQDGDLDNGKEPIQWKVLAVETDRIFVTSVYAIEAMPFHGTSALVSWETSDLRKWLNSEFISVAFSEEQHNRIITTTVSNNDSEEYGTAPFSENDTQDKLFLLSIKEVRTYFPSDLDAGLVPTKYVCDKAEQFSAEYCFYWVRTHALGATPAGEYYQFGFTNAGGCNNLVENIGAIRPAFWLSLE